MIRRFQILWKIIEKEERKSVTRSNIEKRNEEEEEESSERKKKNQKHRTIGNLAE